MRRPIPSVDALPSRPEPYLARGRTLLHLADLSQHTDEILFRLYGPVERAPHGFQSPLGFEASCRRLAARNRMRSLIMNRLVERDIARGRLLLSVENGTRFVS